MKKFIILLVIALSIGVYANTNESYENSYRHNSYSQNRVEDESFFSRMCHSFSNMMSSCFGSGNHRRGC